MRRPIRRWLAALSALCVLALPVTQFAHAEAMAHDGNPHAERMASHHPMTSDAVPHGPRHRHGANCCDLCPACQSAALPPGPAGLAIMPVAHAFRHPATPPALPARTRPHLLPFSHAPPRSSV